MKKSIVFSAVFLMTLPCITCPLSPSAPWRWDKKGSLDASGIANAPARVLATVIQALENKNITLPQDLVQQAMKLKADSLRYCAQELSQWGSPEAQQLIRQLDDTANKLERLPIPKEGLTKELHLKSLLRLMKEKSFLMSETLTALADQVEGETVQAAINALADHKKNTGIIIRRALNFASQKAKELPDQIPHEGTILP